MNKLLLLVAGSMLTGCAGTQPNTKSDQPALEDHVVRLNRDGHMIDPLVAERGFMAKATAKPLPFADARAHVERLLKRAEAHADQVKHGAGTESDPRRVKILIHVHGGLNTFGATDVRVARLAETIKTDRDDWHYPIFVSWPSNAPGTWAEHTFRIREGRKSHPAIGAISAPFVFISDIAQSLGRYPITAYYQLSNEKDIVVAESDSPNLAEDPPSFQSNAWKKAQRNFCQLQGTGNGCDVSEIATSGALSARMSAYYTERFDSASRTLGHLVTAPLRYTAGTLWHSAIAGSAWKNMKRRTSNIFYPPELFDDREAKRIGKLPEAPTGVDALYGGALFEILIDHAQARAGKEAENGTYYAYEVTLVGHSMGAIVLNKTLNVFRDRWLASGILADVVYMGAACSIAEGLEAVAPILQVGRGRAANFYNLMLNRIAEVNETHAAGIVPTGSLLVSIDQHHEFPEHPLERTFGSEVNVYAALDVLVERLSESAGQVGLKAFDRKPGFAPAKHGEFNDIPFWRRSTWRPDGTPSDSAQFNAFSAM